MNTTTLRGIFPDPKPIHRKNFLKENVKHLKEMQGLIQKESKMASTSQTLKLNKYRNVTPKVHSNMNTQKKRSSTEVERPFSQKPPLHRHGARSLFSRVQSENDTKVITHKGVQTVRPEDVSKLYETGVIKYPSPSIISTKLSSKASSPPQTREQATSVGTLIPRAPNKGKTRDQGDAPTEKLTKTLQKLDLEDKHNYIKENMKNIRVKSKKDEKVDPTQPPPDYQKGVLPKYLRGRREEETKLDTKPFEFEGENVNNLVLLPDDERKEYLRVARENYAVLIKELNAMPVSNDTLKRRRRKMEIEQELQRLDEVIKIFQKPKVFVKADS